MRIHEESIRSRVSSPRSAPTAPRLDIGARLKGLRILHGLSQRGLARKTGVTSGIISVIERNLSSPSVATLKKILDGFPMSLADFFAVGESAQDQIFYGASELIEIGGNLLSYRQIGGRLDGKAIQILHERMEPGGDTGPEMFQHAAEEGGVVIRGRVELTVGTRKRILGPGDGYYFDSRIPHRFRNVGTSPCEIVSACSPPSF